MAKSKKHKPKNKKASFKKAVKAKSVKKKIKKAKSVSKKLSAEKKKSDKEKKTPVKENTKKKAVVASVEVITSKPADVSEPPAPKQPSSKAIARAKAALAAKEKAKIPSLPIDKAAAEKQLKLAEPKNKLELEYIVHSSPTLLYEFITTPSGLTEWFADNVNVIGNVYSFFWEGAEQKARVLSARENKSIRFQWTDRPANSYFELRIEKNELTEELSLLITDFAETKEEMNSLEVLWQGQVQRLMKVIGSKI